jgi:hypothetical protein
MIPLHWQQLVVLTTKCLLLTPSPNSILSTPHYAVALVHGHRCFVAVFPSLQPLSTMSVKLVIMPMPMPIAHPNGRAACSNATDRVGQREKRWWGFDIPSIRQAKFCLLSFLYLHSSLSLSPSSTYKATEPVVCRLHGYFIFSSRISNIFFFHSFHFLTSYPTFSYPVLSQQALSHECLHTCPSQRRHSNQGKHCLFGDVAAPTMPYIG